MVASSRGTLLGCVPTAVSRPPPLAVNARAEIRGTLDLARLSVAELAQHPDVLEVVDDAVRQVNSQLASYETIKRFALLPIDLTVENGFLTPTLKVKRKKVEAEFRDLLEGFYAGAAQAI